MKDEIIEELWQIKDELARRANYDIPTLCRELSAKETDSLTRVVDRSATQTVTGVGKIRR